MEIKFADSFFESLKVLKRHNTWWYRTYSTITIDIPHFFKNIYLFRKELYKHRWWDYTFTLMVFKRSLEIQAKGMEERGWEVKESLDKKIVKMKRAIEILDNKIETNYLELAEQQLGPLYDWDFLEDIVKEEEKAHNKKVYALAQKIENKDWEELWKILEGQNHNSYNKEKHGDFEKWYDGSGITAWWD
jgi:Rad3-related DNA helicase